MIIIFIIIIINIMMIIIKFHYYSFLTLKQMPNKLQVQNQNFHQLKIP
jgi:hypothetical protein